MFLGSALLIFNNALASVLIALPPNSSIRRIIIIIMIFVGSLLITSMVEALRACLMAAAWLALWRVLEASMDRYGTDNPE